MREFLFQLDASGPISLQAQIRAHLVSAIRAGQLSANERVPSSRQLARALNVSRNTVSLAYLRLLDDGFLVVRERSGYFVSESIPEPIKAIEPEADHDGIEWRERLRIRPSAQANIEKPQNWHEFDFPFIYGQVDHALFPIAQWRDCVRQALGRKWLDNWTADAQHHDDPMLVEQIRKRLLPTRGISAAPDEILVTLGAQHGLYMLSSLLVSEATTVALENPGYPDLRNIFRLRTDRIIAAGVDAEGLVVDDTLGAAHIICTTPSHQAPTNVTMSARRRTALLAAAARSGALIIEDDYESETHDDRSALPALKAADHDGRVIYVGSLSKTLFPGLRLGYLVGPKEIIREARALRRLMLRHPPSNNQRTVAIFLALGHHDALVARLKRAYAQRWQALSAAFERHAELPIGRPIRGGSSAWVEGPAWLDANALAEQALAHKLIIEPGAIYHAQAPAPRHFYRLGFSSIDAKRIPAGIELLARLVREQRSC